VKNVFSVLLATLLLTITCFGQDKNIPLTNRDLAALYAQYNEDYFLDQLPKDTIVSIGNITSDGFMGYTIKSNNRYYIVLDRQANYARVTAELTLLHEMCHVKTPNSWFHERNFQQCMMDLASQGAFHDLW